MYILMIYADEADWTTKSEVEMAPIMQAHAQLEQDLRKACQYRGCGGLAPSSAATTVRIRAGKPVITDGPYAETKEQFGGYYLVEATNLDEVLSLAKRIPGAGDRAIEVRPILDFRS